MAIPIAIGTPAKTSPNSAGGIMRRPQSDAEHERTGNDERRQERNRREDAALVVLLRRQRRAIGRLAAFDQLAQRSLPQPTNPQSNAFGEIRAAVFRRESARQHVGHDRLQTITDLTSRQMLVHHDQQQ